MRILKLWLAEIHKLLTGFFRRGRLTRAGESRRFTRGLRREGQCPSHLHQLDRTRQGKCRHRGRERARQSPRNDAQQVDSVGRIAHLFLPGPLFQPLHRKAISGNVARPMLRAVITLIGFLSAAPLLAVACVGWAKQRPRPVSWRNGLSVAALLLLSLNWLLCAVAQLPSMGRLFSLSSSDLTNAMFTLWRPLDLVVIALCFAMRGNPRIEIISAALLMLSSTPLGYV
jgi:hypothetical protein